MKKLFFRNIIFRIFNPVMSGFLIYLLILLLNNNVSQLRNEFLGKELYICIGLAFLVQEVVWITRKLNARLKISKLVKYEMVGQVLLPSLFTVIIVSLVIYYYYKIFIGFAPDIYELGMFSGIYLVFALLILSLDISQEFLNKRNLDKEKKESVRLDDTKDEYIAFVKGIHPELLFELLEESIVRLKSSPDKADDLIADISRLYRYLLSDRRNELVLLEREVEVADLLIRLLNVLPHRTVALDVLQETSSYMVPGTLSRFIESIVKASIVSKSSVLLLKLGREDDYFVLSYKPEDKLNARIKIDSFEDLVRRYSVYTSRPMLIENAKSTRKIFIPNLQIQN